MLTEAKRSHVIFARAARTAACLAFVIAGSAVAGNTSYQYDALGRVVKVTYPDAKQICYAYDAAGNRTQVKRQATGTCAATGSTLTGSSLMAGETSLVAEQGNTESAATQAADESVKADQTSAEN